jgi:putative oxidoreductase
MNTTALDARRPQMLSVLRIVSGLIFFAHGTQKMLGFPAPTFDPAMFSLPWFAGAIELVTGALLILGLFTRPAAFLASGTMAAAYWIAHAPQSVHPALNGGDAAILYCFVFLYLVFAGGGSWSLDAVRAGARSPARA